MYVANKTPNTLMNVDRKTDASTTCMVTTFDTVFSKTGNEESIVSVLNQIKNGQWRAVITRCREELAVGNVAEYKKVKSMLSATTFCGTFIGGHRAENLVAYNKLLVLDLDRIPTNEIAEIRQTLSADAYIYSLWLSPSGLGLKGLVRIDSPVEFHKFAFDQIANYFLLKYNIDLDRSGSDICRLCYVSWDPDLYLNEQASVFALDHQLVHEKRSYGASRKSKPYSGDSIKHAVNYQKALYYKTEGRNKASDRRLIQAVIKFLHKKKISITHSHSDWVRVALAIAATFTFDIGEGYFLKLCRLDGGAHDEQKSKDLLDYSYRNRKLNGPSMATILFLASQKGFNS